MRSLCLSLLLLASVPAAAGPILFDATEYSTTAIATLGDDVDIAQDGIAPPDPLPLSSNADVQRDPAFAFADAIADEGFLATSVDLMTVDEDAFAVAVASFLGSFTGAGRLRLDLDFERFDETAGGLAGVDLFVTLTSGLDTLLDEVFTLGGDYTRRIDFGPQTQSGLLGITLVSTGEAQAGTAFTLSSLDFTLRTVPEPSSMLLAVTALGGAMLARRRARRASRG